MGSDLSWLTRTRGQYESSVQLLISCLSVKNWEPFINSPRMVDHSQLRGLKQAPIYKSQELRVYLNIYLSWWALRKWLMRLSFLEKGALQTGQETLNPMCIRRCRFRLQVTEKLFPQMWQMIREEGDWILVLLKVRSPAISRGVRLFVWGATAAVGRVCRRQITCPVPGPVQADHLPDRGSDHLSSWRRDDLGLVYRGGCWGANIRIGCFESLLLGEGRHGEANSGKSTVNFWFVNFSAGCYVEAASAEWYWN